MQYLRPVVSGTKFKHVGISLSDLIAIHSLPDAEWRAHLLTRAYRTYERVTFGMYQAARASVAKADIPQHVRDEAAKWSRELVFSLSSFRSRIVRHQSHGTLDSSKLSRLADPTISARAFDRAAATAYRRRDHVTSQTMRPRVAIVADMNNDIRMRNPDYMRMLGTLAYVLGEAAKLAGVEVALYGSRGGLYGSQNAKLRQNLQIPYGAPPVHIPTILKDWDEDISAQAFSIFTNQYNFVSVIRGATALLNSDDDGMESSCGAGGIEFARMQGANIVLSFGKFPGDEAADLSFEPNAPIAKIVASVVENMGKLGNAA